MGGRGRGIGDVGGVSRVIDGVTGDAQVTLLGRVKVGAAVTFARAVRVGWVMPGGVMPGGFDVFVGVGGMGGGRGEVRHVVSSEAGEGNRFCFPVAFGDGEFALKGSDGGFE